MIEEYKDKENIEAIKKAYYKVFRNRDPYDEPFREDIECVLPLCLIDVEEQEMYCFLRNKQSMALSRVLIEINEKAFYASSLEYGKEIYEVVDENGNLYISATDAYGHTGILGGNRYYKFSTPEEWEQNYNIFSLTHNAFYSTKGEWGGVISGEDPFVLLGGSREFINLFKKHYPEWEKDFQQMKDWYKLYLETEDDSNDVLWTRFVVPDALKKGLI